MPALGKILSRRHGFRCTVLFSQDPDGTINPNNQTNVPGMHLLRDADLVINAFRFRELPDEDMRHFVEYMDSGRPMIVIRTATHAFAYSRNRQSPYARYSWDTRGGEHPGGFGRMTVGETWTYHHGRHGGEATRGIVDGRSRRHPILNSVVDVFGPTDVYGVNEDFPDDARVLLWGLVLAGMEPHSPVNWTKPIMPIVWLREYTSPSGKTSTILCSTIGASVDFASADLRRLIVNAAYHLTGLEVPEQADVRPVGPFQPTMFGFNQFTPGIRPESHVMPPARTNRPPRR